MKECFYFKEKIFASFEHATLNSVKQLSVLFNNTECSLSVVNDTKYC